MENRTGNYSHEKIDLLTLDMEKLRNLQSYRNSDTNEDWKSIKQKIIGVEEYLKGISEFNSYKIDNFPNLPKTELFIFKDKTKPKETITTPTGQRQVTKNDIKEAQEKTHSKMKEKEEQKLNKLKETKQEDKKIELKQSIPTINFTTGSLFQDKLIGKQPINENKNLFGIPSISESKPQEVKIDISKNTSIIQTKIITEKKSESEKTDNFKETPKIQTNIFGAIDTKPKTDQISQKAYSKQEESSKILLSNQSKDEIKSITKLTEQTSNQPYFPLREKLIKAADNYWNLRDVLKEMSNNANNKKAIEKIVFEINTIIDQISQEEHLDERIKTVNTLLKEIMEMKNKQLYVYALNYLCQRIILKSDKYRKEHKKIFLTFAKFIYRISQEHKLLQDYFLMMIVYKCPYVIPIIYNKKEFKDNYSYMKRLGYSTEKETMSDMINNMECYGYFYFAFLSCDNKYISLIKEYMDSLETISIEYPIATVFKTFLNTLGNYVKTAIPNSIEKLKKITEKFSKGLNDLKTSSKSSLLKSVAGENLHFIKLYYKKISTGVKTDMYD